MHLLVVGFKSHIPNMLTAGRLAAVPVVGWAVCADASTLATASFAAASVTDFLDGYLARRWHVESAFGAFLDPVVDKLLVAATLVCLASKMPLVAGPAALVVCREIAVSALREWCAQRSQRDLVQVAFAGKLKTTAQMLALLLLLSNTLLPVALPALYLATLLTVLSGLRYFQVAWPLLTAPL